MFLKKLKFNHYKYEPLFNYLSHLFPANDTLHYDGLSVSKVLDDPFHPTKFGALSSWYLFFK